MLHQGAIKNVELLDVNYVSSVRVSIDIRALNQVVVITENATPAVLYGKYQLAGTNSNNDLKSIVNRRCLVETDGINHTFKSYFAFISR